MHKPTQATKTKTWRGWGTPFHAPWVGNAGGELTRNKLQVQQNKTPSWSSTDSHPSDKNKDVRWMGHGFIPRESAKPVDDQKKQECKFSKTMNNGKTPVSSPVAGEAGGRLRGSQPYNLTGNCGGVEVPPKRGVARTGRIPDGLRGTDFMVRRLCGIPVCPP